MQITSGQQFRSYVIRWFLIISGLILFLGGFYIYQSVHDTLVVNYKNSKLEQLNLLTEMVARNEAAGKKKIALLHTSLDVFKASTSELLNIYSLRYHPSTQKISYGKDSTVVLNDTIKIYNEHYELIITTDQQRRVRFKRLNEYVSQYQLTEGELVYHFAISKTNQQKTAITVNNKVILEIDSTSPLSAHYGEIKIDATKSDSGSRELANSKQKSLLTYQFVKKDQPLHQRGEPYIIRPETKSKLAKILSQNPPYAFALSDYIDLDLGYLYGPLIKGKKPYLELMVMEVPRKTINKDSKKLLNSIATGFSFLTIFSMLAAIFFARKITDPLEQLTQAISRLIKNDFNFKLSPKGFGRFGFLANQFNMMLIRIQKSRGELIQLNKSYSRFVPHQLLKQLSSAGVRKISLGDCSEREMTVLFCDIREFTTLSESMSPEANFKFINRYLSKIAPVINKRGGIIDKYLGDGIMALFPNGADEALTAANEMLRALELYNVKLKKKNLPVIKVGLGLHSGKMMLGTVGTASRMDATVVSDAVNAAARVESLTKSFCTEILITDETKKQLEDLNKYKIRYIATCTIRGKSQPVTLYEVYNNDPISLQKEKTANQQGMIRAWNKYKEGDAAIAVQMYQQMIEISPNDPSLFALIERCQSGRL